MLALVAAAAVVGWGGGASPAGAAPARSKPAPLPALSLLDQSPWVRPTTPGATHAFTLSVAAAPGTPSADEVVTTLYTALRSRSALEQTLRAAPTGTVLDRTHPVALSAMPAAGGGRTLAITVLPDPTATPAPAAGAPTLDLHCVGTGTCTGVYPLVVSLVRPRDGRTVPVPGATFTTYLTYATSKSSTPLDFAWVAPVAAPVAVRPATRSPADAVTAPSASTAAALAGLVATLAARPSVPVTVAASPETLQALAAQGGRGQRAVAQLASMSTGDQSVRQFLPEPYVPVDLGALAGAGEGEEVAAQFKLGASVLHTLGVTTTDDPGTWVAAGTAGSALRTGLDQVGDTRLVLPDADLAPARGIEDTWASAFVMNLGRGAPVTAAAADGGLAAHFTADPADPALEANQLLADLAMIHFEAPNTATARGVIAVPPAGWVPTRAFDAELLAGLATDPVVRPTTVSGYFDAFSAALAQTPPTRHLSGSGPGPVLSRALAARITAARLHLTAFDTAVRANPPVESQLDRLLLASECDDLTPAAQAAGVGDFGQVLGAQLAQFQLATERTVTLTARTGLIPVTIESTARYTVVGTLVLSGGRFVFPHGDTRRLTLDHPTNPVRIDVEARTSGELPLVVVFRSPTGHLVIVSGQLTIRSTATSLAGIVLSVLALLVLLGWWARTWWNGRRRRREAGDPA